MDERTADAYTRGHREVIEMVWDMISRKHAKAEPTEGRPTPHSLKCDELNTLEVSNKKRKADDKLQEITIRHLKEQGVKDTPAPTKPDMPKKPFLDTTDLHNGPLRLARNGHKNRLHLITTEDKGIHCGWRYRKKGNDLISDKTSCHKKTNPKTTKCTHCFRPYTIPEDWEKTECPVGEKSDIEDQESGMSETSDSE